MPNQRTKMLRFIAVAFMMLAVTVMANAQDPAAGKWQKLKNQPTVQTDQALLLTDGTVLMHQYNSPNWWKLTPSSTGYADGTWSQVASMQSGYAPLYFASAILPDGRLLV